MKPLRYSSKLPTDAPPSNIVRLFQSETSEILEAPEPFAIRATTYIAIALLAAMIILAAVIRLDRVIESVQGELVSTTPEEVLQSLDPALIKTINVKAGDPVKKGQILATLDPTFAAADVDAVRLQVANYDAVIARAEAELAGRVYQPKPTHDRAAARYGEMQKDLFQQRKANRDEQFRAYEAQISEYQATLAKLKNNESRYAERSQIAGEIENMRTTLAQMQVGSRLNQLTAIDARIEALRNVEENHNTLAETEQKLAGARASRDAFIQKWKADTSQELVTARGQRDTASQQLEKASRKKDLVVLKAGQDSVVLRVAKLSVGAVLKDAEPLMYLAPVNSPLEAEIRIAPRDIGFVRIGDPVKMKLDAFDFVEHGMVLGQIEWISEGVFLVDERTNQPTTQSFYKAHVKLTDTALRNIPPGFRLIAGMNLQADVWIGTRSILMYMLGGAAKTFGEGMREAQ